MGTVVVGAGVVGAGVGYAVGNEDGNSVGLRVGAFVVGLGVGSCVSWCVGASVNGNVARFSDSSKSSTEFTLDIDSAIAPLSMTRYTAIPICV